MSWGYKILTVYLVFVAGIAVLVYKSTTQNIDLVTTDYYAKELKYQDRIDALKRTKALSTKVKYELNGNAITIILPAEFDSSEVTGNVMLYYPADKNKDVKKDFSTNNRTITVELPAATKGSYGLQVSWESGTLAYYFEENLFL